MDGLDTGFFFDLWDETEDAQTLWRGLTENDEPAAVSSITLSEISRHGLVGRLDPSFAETITQRAGVAYEQTPVEPTDVLNRGAPRVCQSEIVERGSGFRPPESPTARASRWPAP